MGHLITLLNGSSTGGGSTPSFSPLDLSPNAWWDSDNGPLTSGGYAGVGDPVGLWLDSSGNSNDAGQDDPPKKPLLQSVTNGGQTFNVVRFDGVDDVLSCSDAVLFELLAVTCFVVINGSPAPSTGLVAKREAGASPTNYEYFAGGNMWNGASFAGPAESTTGCFLRTFTQDAGGFTSYRNGTSVFSGAQAIGATNAGPLFIGASYTDQECFTGDIAAVILYNSILSNSDRAAVEAYLMTRYGIS